jgi:protein-disulfide isomerase
VSREAKILIGVLVLVVAAMVGLFVLTGSGKQPASTGSTADQSKLVKDTSHKQGSGPVTVVEFGDYQCPACGQAYPIVKQLQDEYKGKLTLVFRNFPLTNIHQNAQVGAQAAEAAGLQNKFWEMHDKLYENQSAWTEQSDPTEVFVGYAKDLGLDTDKFKSDLTSQKVKDIIAADVADGNALNIQGTPTIWVNGQQASGYQHDTLKELIDQALNKK